MSTTVVTPINPAVLPAKIGPFRTKRLLVALIMVVLAVFPGELGALTRSLMTDAYVQVSAFVATTLL